MRIKGMGLLELMLSISLSAILVLGLGRLVQQAQYTYKKITYIKQTQFAAFIALSVIHNSFRNRKVCVLLSKENQFQSNWNKRKKTLMIMNQRLAQSALIYSASKGEDQLVLPENFKVRENNFLLLTDCHQEEKVQVHATRCNAIFCAVQLIRPLKYGFLQGAKVSLLQDMQFYTRAPQGLYVKVNQGRAVELTDEVKSLQITAANRLMHIQLSMVRQHNMTIDSNLQVWDLWEPSGGRDV